MDIVNALARAESYLARPRLTRAQHNSGTLLLRLLWGAYHTSKDLADGAPVYFTSRMVGSHLQISLHKARQVLALGVKLRVLKRHFGHRYTVTL
jgi:hypothetical protein